MHMALLFGRYRLRSVRRRQIQAEPKASACIGDKYRPFYRTTTHMFN